MNNCIEETECRERFWERYSLDEMNDSEWEALCDGCGLCCLFKFQDQNTKEVTYTNVACRLLDKKTCSCKNYSNRSKIVHDCVKIRPENVDDVIDWLPSTCAYRLVHEGRQLFDWHYLISGNSESVHEAQISVKERCIPEYKVDLNNLELYATDWEKS